MKYLLLMPLIFAVAATTITDEQRSCSSDSDCVLVSRGGCCGRDTAVNRLYEKIAEKPVHPGCARKKFKCEPKEAACQEGSCVVVPKQEAK